MHAENNYKNFPALAAYIDRIGAEEISFKTFMVKIHRNHYYNERCLIRIDTDARTISCTHKDYAPSDAEEIAILNELANRVFPTAIGADDIAGLIKTIQLKGGKVNKKDLFELWDRRTGKIVMVQRRFMGDDGRKQYHPWTLFNDGVWRQLEPGGDLPFWKPRKKLSAHIMVHEGAKAAQFVEWLVRSKELESLEARQKHPWAAELEKYEHWGIIGGALAPHRANYSELAAERPAEVVYCADNDDPGRRVLNTFSKMYEGQLKWVKFDSRWPQAWDMADPMPDKFFVKHVNDPEQMHYRGPTLTSMLRPATFATEMIPNPAGVGRPIVALRSAFAEEWYHSVQPELFVHRDHPAQLYTAQEFNSEIAPFSQTDDLARLVRKDAANKMRTVYYAPNVPSGLSGTVERGQFINTYYPSPVRPMKGDPKPFLDYMEHLIPVEGDRQEVLRWCATLIAKPAIKMSYGLLLVSERQGAGKSTLGEKILAPLVGLENTSFPSETDIVESQFNAWLSHKRLSVIHEIYAGNSSKAYNKLKSIITDKFVTVNKKHQSTYELENWTHIFACSNSNRALRISMDDRRWLLPQVTEEMKPHEYWVGFNEWLENGGLEIIRWWADEWLKKNKPVFPGQTAPYTQAKEDFIDDSLSAGQAIAKALLEEMWRVGKSSPEPVFTTDALIVQEIKDRLYDGKNSTYLEKPATVRKLAKDRGLAVGTERARQFSHDLTLGRVIATSPALARRNQEMMKAEGLKPFDFSKIGRSL